MVCTALVGTVMTPTTWLMITLTDADIPGRSDGLAPLRTTVTGKVATPDVTVASSATSVTLPATASLDPAATTCAVCPDGDLVDQRVAHRTGDLEDARRDDHDRVARTRSIRLRRRPCRHSRSARPLVTLTSSTMPPVGRLERRGGDGSLRIADVDLIDLDLALIHRDLR